jgi:hypothetical protein
VVTNPRIVEINIEIPLMILRSFGTDGVTE